GCEFVKADVTQANHDFEVRKVGKVRDRHAVVYIRAVEQVPDSAVGYGRVVVVQANVHIRGSIYELVRREGRPHRCNLMAQPEEDAAVDGCRLLWIQPMTPREVQPAAVTYRRSVRGYGRGYRVEPAEPGSSRNVG